jgi:hypothetical protein
MAVSRPRLLARPEQIVRTLTGALERIRLPALRLRTLLQPLRSGHFLSASRALLWARPPREVAPQTTRRGVVGRPGSLDAVWA